MQHIECAFFWYVQILHIYFLGEVMILPQYQWGML